jgi:hypothetical protein
MRRTWIAALAAALVVSACAAGEVSSSESSSTTTVAFRDTPATSPESSTTTSESPPPTLTADSATDEITALLATLDASAASSSGRIEGSFTVTGVDEATGLTEATITFSSAFDTESGNGSFSIDMSSLAAAVEDSPVDSFAGLSALFAEAIEFRQVGDRAYARVPFFGEMLGVDTEWISMPAEDGGAFASGLETVPSDPAEVLDAYEGADATVANLGTEAVNGVEATHYRITFDTARMVDELTDEERAELEASGIFADGSIPIEVWISSDGYLIRLVLEIDASSADLPPEQSFETMVVRYDVFDIGSNVVVVAPPEEDVTPIEEVAPGSINFDMGT